MVVALRVFVAVPVPDEVRYRIIASLDAVVDTIPGKVVRPGNWHVTLRFRSLSLFSTKQRVYP